MEEKRYFFSSFLWLYHAASPIRDGTHALWSESHRVLTTGLPGKSLARILTGEILIWDFNDALGKKKKPFHRRDNHDPSKELLIL